MTLNISGTNGSCGTSKDMVVNVQKTDYPDFPAGLSFCDVNTNAVINVTPWLFGNGVNYSQIPLSPLSASDTLAIQPFGSNGKFDPTVMGAGSWQFIVSYTNLNGCTGMSIDTIHVLPSPSNGVTLTGTTLTANAVGGYSYQWFDCTNGNTPISGAIAQSYTPTVTGTYGVSITAGNCSSESACTDVVIVGVDELNNELGIKMYPNPVADILKIDKGGNSELTIALTNGSGKLIYSTTTKMQIFELDMSKYSSGVYFIKINNTQQSEILKFVKM